jgi:methionyl-tRNA formyltransferase
VRSIRVLFLGPVDSPTLVYLHSTEQSVVATADPISISYVQRVAPDFVVSHGYRHIVPKEILEFLPGRFINLHISLLPWNRGSDPNLWSFFEGTPKGVTIHFMDEGVDTGDVIAQRRVRFSGDETLRSSYERLQAEILDLFEGAWPRIRLGQVVGQPQKGEGSYHGAADREEVEHLLLPNGWNTPVSKVADAGRRRRMRGREV